MYIKKLKTVLQSKYIFKLIFILLLIYGLIMNNVVTYKSKYNIDTNEFILTIDRIKIDNNKINLDVIGKEKLKLTYYYKNKKEISNLKLGDTIKVTGNLEIPSKNTMSNTFNYQNYLYKNNYNYILKANNIKKIKNNTNIKYEIRKKILQRIDNAKKSRGYIKVLTLANKDNIDNNTMNKYYDLGISHLFSISGMHFSLISAFLLLILRKISYNKIYNYIVVITILFLYSVIIDFPPSVIRTLIMFILFSINKLLNLKIKPLDIMLLVFSISILINPFLLYNMGYQFSYLISLSLIILAKNIQKINNKLLKSLYISYITFLVSFPICIYNFYEVNLISILLNIIVIPLVSIFIFPLSILTIIFPFLDNILYIFIKILEIITNLFYKITFTKLIFAKPNLYIIIIYYILIYFILLKRKYISIFIILLVVHKNITYFKYYYEVNFLDVNQGDSLLLIYPNNKSNILIDTGGILNSNFSITNNKTIPYLKSIGITKINYLIITHGDYDHMGETINLVNNFKIEKVIFNCGEFNNLEKELISVLNKKNIKYYSCIKELNTNNNKLYFINNKDYGNENDNSIVLYTKLNNNKFLFMADASIKTEKDIINKYNIKDIDVIKVGHHGSKTSSSKEYIDKINPKYSVISVGKNNRYGHPNSEVLEILDKSKIYRTDIDGSIMFKLKNNKLDISTCPP